MTYYRIYSRALGQNKFKPMDLAEGTQVTNLIHATLIPESQLPRVMALLEDYEGEMQFQARRVQQ